MALPEPSESWQACPGRTSGSDSAAAAFALCARCREAASQPASQRGQHSGCLGGFLWPWLL